MRPFQRAIHVRLAVSLTLIVIFALIVPASAGTAGAGMRQTKRYQSAGSASLRVAAPFVLVGVGDPGSGLGPEKIGEPVSFRVPAGARSISVTIVDDSGLPVRAFVDGAAPWVAPDGHTYTPPVCGPAPVKMALARDARVLRVFLDTGLWGAFLDAGLVRLGAPPGSGGTSACEPSVASPNVIGSWISLPTSGTINVLFSKRRVKS
jgi:hypothetical protein